MATTDATSMQVHRGEADTRRSFIKRAAGFLGTSVLAGSAVSCDDDVTNPRSPDTDSRDVSERIDRKVGSTHANSPLPMGSTSSGKLDSAARAGASR
ncbi:MAG: hypothetical protein GEU90_21090 [Gemmatimonas sp.]|nr:hypothetical protein [Gemmatimonas sp.]